MCICIYPKHIYIYIMHIIYKLHLVRFLSMRSSFQQNFQLEEPHQPGSHHLVVVDGVVIWRLGVRALTGVWKEICFPKDPPRKKHTQKKHGTAVNFAGTKGSGVEP